MSLLTITQEACGRMGLTQPTAVVGSTDPQVLQLLALVNVAGRDLASSYPWQALTKTQTWTTAAANAQPTAIPADFDRLYPNSEFNRTTRRSINGPVTAAQWQALMAQPQLNTAYLMFNVAGGVLNVSPAPPAGQTGAFAYISKNWVASSGGTPQSALLADTDTAVLDEHLMADSLVWRFLRAKGLSYGEEMSTFSRNLEQTQGRDGGSTMLSLTPRPVDLTRANVPDGNFGV